MFFRILIGLDGAAAAVAVYFFLTGLADGSVSAFNIELWLGILAGIAAILAGGVLLHRKGHPVLANLVLAVLAVPAALYVLFMLIVIGSGARWN